MKHRHDWWPAAPIDPKGDPGNAVARAAHDFRKTFTYACDCGAQKAELFTSGFRNIYITRDGGRLWRGRRKYRPPRRARD